MPLLRPPGSPPPWPDPDADQAWAIGHRGGALCVRGAAGTGKTVTALRLVADRVESGLSTDDVLLEQHVIGAQTALDAVGHQPKGGDRLAGARSAADAQRATSVPDRPRLVGVRIGPGRR